MAIVRLGVRGRIPRSPGSIVYSSNPSSGMANTVRAFFVEIGKSIDDHPLHAHLVVSDANQHVRKADPVNSSLTNAGAFQRRKK